MSANFVIRPKLQVLTEEQIGAFYAQMVEVLDRVGVCVMHPEALALLKKAGAPVIRDTIVRIPAVLLERAIQSVPKRVTIHDRDGNPVMTLGGPSMHGQNTYYGTGSDLRHTYDHVSGELRLTTTQDIANMATVVDYLSDVDFLMSYGIPSEVPLEQVYRAEFFHMVTNSSKPIVFTSDNGDDCRNIIEMAAVVAGGREALRERAFVLAYTQPTSPLQHSADATGKVFACADAGIPPVYPPGMMPGATAPATLAGAVAQSLAESFSMLVIHQLRCEGAPIVLGGAHGCMDMRTMVNIYAAPERLLTEAVLCAINQHFGIPTWGFGGCTDAQVLDEQAGMEFAFLAMWASLTGVNLAHDVGYLGNGMVGDLRAIVLNNEINSYVRHVVRTGVPVSRETQAFDAIARVGHGGNFLADDHTLAHFREAFWRPHVSNRYPLNVWRDHGSTTMKSRLKERVADILAQHKPAALPSSVFRTLEQLLNR